MALFGWIIRFLAVLFVVRLLVRMVTGGRRAPAPPRPGRTPATREGGQLVRDPHCGTYVPIARALRAGSSSEPVYFCSDACRTAWASRSAG